MTRSLYDTRSKLIPGPDNRYRYCECGVFINIEVQDLQTIEPFSCLMCLLKRNIAMLEAADRHTACICCRAQVEPSQFIKYLWLCRFCAANCDEHKCTKTNHESPTEKRID